MPNKANASPTSTPPTPPEEGQKAEKNGDPTKEALGDPAPVVTKAFQTQALPNGKTQTSVKTMSKRKISQQKEKKATQMLAIVLGEFFSFFCCCLFKNYLKLCAYISKWNWHCVKLNITAVKLLFLLSTLYTQNNMP